MLFDPSLLDALQNRPTEVLGVECLSPAELKELQGIDPRWLRADPHRAARLIHARVTEYPVSTLFHTGGKTSLFFAFFQSDSFHESIHGWGSLRDAFEDWLLQNTSESIGQFVRLEGTIARCRERASKRVLQGNGTLLRLAPGVALWKGSEALIDYYDKTLRKADLNGEEILLSLRDAPPAKCPQFKETGDVIMIHATDDGKVQLECLPPALAAFLAALEHCANADAVVAAGLCAGADSREELEELIGELKADGIVTGNLLSAL